MPQSFDRLTNLKELDISGNNFSQLPECLSQLKNLEQLDIGKNQIGELPNFIGTYSKLKNLNLEHNKISQLPESIVNLVNLTDLELGDNPLEDLSILQKLPKLEFVRFPYFRLPRRYWIKLNEWQASWLLDESNSEVRMALVDRLGDRIG